MPPPKKTVDIKLHDDETGQVKVIPVPAPEEFEKKKRTGKEEDEDEGGEEEVELDVDVIAHVARSIHKQKLRGTRSDEEIKEMFPEFVDQYPVLTDRCLDPAFSLEKLDFVMHELRELRLNRVSKDRATDKVVDEMNSTYVNGVVDMLESKRKAEEAAKKREEGHQDAERAVELDDARTKLRRRIAEARARRAGALT